MNELLRPWKLATLALGTAALLAGQRVLPAPDWDTGISLLMAGFTYLLAPWVVRAGVERRWCAGPAAALAAWWCVDGVYAVYWSVVDPGALELMRDVNWPASAVLFTACGLLWMPRCSLRECLRLALRRPGPRQSP